MIIYPIALGEPFENEQPQPPYVLGGPSSKSPVISDPCPSARQGLEPAPKLERLRSRWSNCCNLSGWALPSSLFTVDCGNDATERMMITCLSLPCAGTNHVFALVVDVSNGASIFAVSASQVTNDVKLDVIIAPWQAPFDSQLLLSDVRTSRRGVLYWDRAFSNRLGFNHNFKKISNHWLISVKD